MPIIISSFVKMLPLYVFIAMGYLASRKLKIERGTLAGLILYFINPLIICLNLLTLDLNVKVLSFPLIIFCLCAFMAMLFRYLGRKIYGKENLKDILAFTAGTGNTGYFGLGMILAFFGKETFSIAIIAVLGFILYDNSLGYYLVSSGKNSMKEGMIRVLTLPTFQAFIVGILLNVLGVRIGGPFLDMLEYAKSSYVLLGMMLVGIGLRGVKTHHFDKKFLSLCLGAKFIIWPLLVCTFIFIDRIFFGLLTVQMSNILLMLSIVPMAANTIVFASELNINPEKASLAVFVSTLLGLIYIPTFLSIWGIKI